MNMLIENEDRKRQKKTKGRKMVALVKPNEVDAKEFDFKTSYRRDWYDADQVDDFLDDVHDTILELAKDNIRLRKRL
jgi:cell division septum initiation protein DivIVA